MSRSFLNSIQFDTDQQKGSTDKNAVQQDYIQNGIIKTVSGFSLYLAVVADGGGKNAPDQAAKLVVDTIFSECKRGNEEKVVDLLRNALTMANQVVYQQNQGKDYVGITIVAVKDDRIFLGQVGKLTRAYLVQNSQMVIQLPAQSEAQSDNCLGDSPDLQEILVEPIKDTIKQGERVILCSDGLFDPLDKNQKDADVKIKTIQKVLEQILLVGQYDDIRGSARHLSSIAKGLDANDDITVMVLGFGRKPKGIITPLLATIIGVAILAIIGIIALLLTPKAPVPIPDLGVAFIVKGNANAIDPKTSLPAPLQQVINPGTTLQVSPNEALNLELESRTDLQSTNTTLIDGVNLYLAKATEAVFSTINLAPTNIQNQPTDPALLNQTQITLINGQLLIVSTATRNFVILTPLQNGKGNIDILLNSGTKGILGLKINNSTLEVDCLQGNCQFSLNKGQLQPLASPGKSMFNLSNSSVSSQDQPMPDSDMKGWATICQNAQLPNTDLSGACNLSQ